MVDMVPIFMNQHSPINKKALLNLGSTCYAALKRTTAKGDRVRRGRDQGKKGVQIQEESINHALLSSAL